MSPQHYTICCTGSRLPTDSTHSQLTPLLLLLSLLILLLLWGQGNSGSCSSSCLCRLLGIFCRLLAAEQVLSASSLSPLCYRSDCSHSKTPTCSTCSRLITQLLLWLLLLSWDISAGCTVSSRCFRLDTVCPLLSSWRPLSSSSCSPHRHRTWSTHSRRPTDSRYSSGKAQGLLFFLTLLRMLGFLSCNISPRVTGHCPPKPLLCWRKSILTSGHGHSHPLDCS